MQTRVPKSSLDQRDSPFDRLLKHQRTANRFVNQDSSQPEIQTHPSNSLRQVDVPPALIPTLSKAQHLSLACHQSTV